MLSRRQVVQISKKIAAGLDQVDQWQGSIDFSDLLIIPEVRPAAMSQMIADEMLRSGSTEAEAFAKIAVATRVAFNAKRDSAQQRVDVLKCKLNNNGTPYSLPMMDRKFEQALEAQLAKFDRVIEHCNEGLADRQINGDKSVVDAAEALEMLKGLISATSRRRGVLRRLGRSEQA